MKIRCHSKPREYRVCFHFNFITDSKYGKTAWKIINSLCCAMPRTTWNIYAFDESACDVHNMSLSLSLLFRTSILSYSMSPHFFDLIHNNLYMRSIADRKFGCEKSTQRIRAMCNMKNGSSDNKWLTGNYHTSAHMTLNYVFIIGNYHRKTSCMNACIPSLDGWRARATCSTAIIFYYLDFCCCCCFGFISRKWKITIAPSLPSPAAK